MVPVAPSTSSISSQKEDYKFVEEPSRDFFCPVTMGLLLQPQLTSCCGKHLSQEVANRMLRENSKCPLCKAHCWSATWDKNFQRNVKSLLVFCCNKESGCSWTGELSALDYHIQSCPKNGVPLQAGKPQLTL